MARVSGKTLLIISGGPNAADTAARTRALGHVPVVSDNDPQAPAFAFAESCLLADPWGAQETAAAAERYSRKIRRIDGVVCCNEAAATTAQVGERLRLSALPAHVAELAGDRLRVRRALQSAGLETIWFAEIATPQDLQRAVIARGRALTVKPVEQRGESGITRLDETGDLGAAFVAARAASPTERVLVEDGGEMVLAAGLMHARQARAEDPRIAALLERAASALGLEDGPIAALVTADGLKIAEISPGLALSGALLDAAILQALGE
jgi:biotin carboxylase